ncbi:MAG: phosphate signaling complex protein PhoU [Opitutaceae bacterium]|nr:phosphate signaling complex protein PhoU [Opitutaceae bacterium]
MATHLEVSLQRDIERIRNQVTEMGALAEEALQDCVKAMTTSDRQLAYAVILRDQYIDEKEKEIDRLCLEFLVRQQPVGGPLRFAYSTIRINLELERVGDYAESIARQLLKLSKNPVEYPKDQFTDLANHSLQMLHDATEAFVKQDAELARKTIEVEDAVDLRRNKLIKDLANLYRENKLPFEALDPLNLITRRFERVADQARNMCMDTLYMCTGEYSKHRGADAFRVLFVDEHDSSRTKIADAIAASLNLPKFVFTSAGLDPQPTAAETIAFLKGKGHDTSHLVPRALHQLPGLEHYHLIVALSPAVKKAFPRRPRNGVYLEWTIKDPLEVTGDPMQVKTAHEECYATLKQHIDEIMQAIVKT